MDLYEWVGTVGLLIFCGLIWIGARQGKRYPWSSLDGIAVIRKWLADRRSRHARLRQLGQAQRQPGPVRPVVALQHDREAKAVGKAERRGGMARSHEDRRSCGAPT